MNPRIPAKESRRPENSPSSREARRAARGWRKGTAGDFLGLSDDESAFIAIRLHLAKAMQDHRRQRRLTQVATAQLLESSQSRVAKMEAGDPTVSVDLLIRSLLRLGATPASIGRVLGKCG